MYNVNYPAVAIFKVQKLIYQFTETDIRICQMVVLSVNDQCALQWEFPPPQEFLL